MKEKEISISDLIRYILLHWRGIIAAMLIGGILLGGYSFIRAHKNVPEEPEQTETEEETLTEVISKYLAGDEPDLEAAVNKLLKSEGVPLNDALKKGLEAELTEKQLINIEYALYYEALYLNNMDYQQNSILMQMDPGNVQKAEMTIMISSDDMERTYNLTKVYEDIAFSTELLEKMSEYAKVSTDYIDEIYYLERTSASRQDGADTFKVSISHYDEKTCEMLLQLVIDYITSEQDSLRQLWGKHDVIFFNKSLCSISNKDVLTIQQNKQEYILKLKSYISNLKGAFSDEEWYYYNLLTLDQVAGNPYEDVTSDLALKEDDPLDGAEEETLMSRISAKQVLIGIILAAFMYVFVLFMIYALNTKIRSSDRFDDLYDIPHLGKIPSENVRKKKFGFLDDRILALCNKNQPSVTKSDALVLTGTAVKMAAKRKGLNEVYFIGCTPNGTISKDCQKLKAICEEDNITIHILENILYDAAAMVRLNDAVGVVLVEKAGATQYLEIEREIELFNMQGITILGGIMME